MAEPVINYTAPDGSKHRIPLPAGGDPAAVVAAFEREQGFDAIPDPALPEIATPDDSLPTSNREALAQRGASEPLFGTNRPQTVPERIERGIAMSPRPLVGALPKAATSIADLAGSLGNVIAGGFETVDADIANRERQDVAPFPTDSTQRFDEFLNRFFPEPQGFERIVIEGGELALSGGAGGAALASRIPAAARSSVLPSRAAAGSRPVGAPQVTRGGASGPQAAEGATVRGIGDEIGQFFANNPHMAAALETGSGLGSVTGTDLAERADLGPGGQAIAAITGGVLGGVAPAAGLNVARRGAQAGGDLVSGISQRAARAVQEEASDIPTAVAATRDRPDGVLPARASEDQNLMAMEARTLADDPKLARQTRQDLERVEAEKLDELANQFGPTTDKQSWQQNVILEGAPDNASIRVGQPDEMLDQAYKAFRPAYEPVHGFRVFTRKVSRDGELGSTLRTELENATGDPRVVADKKWRRGISNLLEGLLDDTTARGTRTGGSDDNPIHQLQSEDLLDLRSTIRDEIRRRRSLAANNPRTAAEVRLLDNANRVVTDVLENQLPAEQAAALRATDARYRQHKIVEDAVLRSGEQGLTATALRAATRRSADSPSEFARGESGELGRLAETGADLGKALATSAKKQGDPQRAARIVRNMSDDELRGAKASLSDELQRKATKTVQEEARLNGVKLLDEISRNREVLKAAKFTDKEIKGMERIARDLKVVQAREPEAVIKLLDDNLNAVQSLLAAVAGSKSGTAILKMFGTAGAGPSLILANWGSKNMRAALKGLTVDRADGLIRGALRGDTVEIGGETKSLMEVLLTTPTATTTKQAQLARVLQTYTLEAGEQLSNEDE